MKFLATVAALAIFAQTAFSQAVPYTQTYGPKRPGLPKENVGAGVFHGDKRILQIVHGRKYYQPIDFVLPVRPFAATLPKGLNWGINRVNTWTNGKEWVEAWQLQGYISTQYNLFSWEGGPPKMTEPPWPE